MRLETLFLCAGIALSGNAFASPSPSTACQSVEAACQAAGYSDQSKTKNLRNDCMEPILAGRKVQDVEVKAADVSACARQGMQREKSAQPGPEK